MGFDTSQFLRERGASAIGSLLERDTRRVATDPTTPPDASAIPDAGQAPTAEPGALHQLYQWAKNGGTDGKRQTGQPPPSPSGAHTDDDEPVYIPLSKEEMEASADSKTDMFAAVLAMVICGFKSLAAKQHLKTGDKKVIDDHERRRRITGDEPVYAPNHPYYAARDRYDEFERLMDEAENESFLSDGQIKLLHRAILADIKAKDKNKRLKTMGIYGTVGEILIGKMAETGLTILVNQIIRMNK